jgi:hypothetical protein
MPEVTLEGRRLHWLHCTDLKRPIGGWYSATADATATRYGVRWSASPPARSTTSSRLMSIRGMAAM